MRFQVESVWEMKSFFDKIQGSIKQKLHKETVTILEAQTVQCNIFKDVIIDRVRQVDELVKEIRSHIQDEHNAQPDKSFLRSSLDSYLKTLPTPDLQTLEELLEKDAKMCKGAL